MYGFHSYQSHVDKHICRFTPWCKTVLGEPRPTSKTAILYIYARPLTHGIRGTKLSRKSCVPVLSSELLFIQGSYNQLEALHIYAHSFNLTTTNTILILQVKELRLGETEESVSGYPASRQEPELESDSGLHGDALNPQDIIHILNHAAPLKCRQNFIQAGRKSSATSCPWPAWEACVMSPSSHFLCNVSNFWVLSDSSILITSVLPEKEVITIPLLLLTHILKNTSWSTKMTHVILFD